MIVDDILLSRGIDRGPSYLGIRHLTPHSLVQLRSQFSCKEGGDHTGNVDASKAGGVDDDDSLDTS